ncbi:MAG TPA: hypothetical protein VJU59_10490 [Paraburkholderia sp.]|uniref:hypothetical protein n=1 Tax=Paraburkholderia sp. TaxID=1926495 RepID=UPI002B4968B0|nr:hypothetical protein [Paraburkholderia sp.]HKR40084.1 hypothetical protein [Paraburkholderia sp.]
MSTTADAPNPENAPVLRHSTVTALMWEHFKITGEDGKPATLAIIDENGKVLDVGPQVADELWELALLAYRQYLTGEGLLRIYSTPEGLLQDHE